MFARGAAALLALVPLTVGFAPAAATAVPASVGNCASSIVRRLDLRERVGQVLLIGVPVDSAASAAVPALNTHKVGGIFFAGRSYRSVASVRDSADAIQRAARAATGVAAHVAVDQEGGLVQTLKGPGFTRIQTAEQQGTLSPATLRARTAAWSAQLRAAGVTLDLAPVADTVSVSPASANAPVGALHRGYGDDPASVSLAVSSVVTGMQSQQVAATLKHFPGLGRVRYNPDTSTLARDSVATSVDPNLAPFAAGIRAGARAVMMSSARYPRLDPANPALLSRAIVTDLLQAQLGFDGVVMTDDIGAAAALSGVPLGQRATRFINAGGHLVLSVRAADAGTLSRALMAHAAANPAFRRRIDDAATRVMQSKVDAAMVACPA